MGLDTTHDCWHGAYSAFQRWRETLAEAAGIPLNLMEGFEQPRLVEAAQLLQTVGTWKTTGESFAEYLTYRVKWESLKPDILHELLNHSDCDGVLEVEILEPLADRLEELLPRLEGIEEGGHVGNYQVKTQKFIDGLRLAASLGEPVEFL